MTTTAGPIKRWEESAETRRFRTAIKYAFQNEEPDSLYYEFEKQLEEARENGILSVGEWSGLQGLLDHWWEGRGDLDRDYRGEC